MELAGGVPPRLRRRGDLWRRVAICCRFAMDDAIGLAWGRSLEDEGRGRADEMGLGAWHRMVVVIKAACCVCSASRLLLRPC